MLCLRIPTGTGEASTLTATPPRRTQSNKNVDELNPDLRAFAKHSGKLLLYHGCADQQVAPGSSVEFYNAVLNESGGFEQTSDWARLFMAPGMAHCSGGGAGYLRQDQLD